MPVPDTRWFRLYPTRQCRLRAPAPGEFAAAWFQLGDHQTSRRRVLIWRVPADNPGRGLVPDGLMRVPFITRSDESIEDDDRALLSVLADLMRGAASVVPVGGFAITEEAPGFPGWGADG